MQGRRIENTRSMKAEEGWVMVTSLATSYQAGSLSLLSCQKAHKSYPASVSAAATLYASLSATRASTLVGFTKALGATYLRTPSLFSRLSFCLVWVVWSRPTESRTIEHQAPLMPSSCTGIVLNMEQLLQANMLLIGLNIPKMCSSNALFELCFSHAPKRQKCQKKC